MDSNYTSPELTSQPRLFDPLQVNLPNYNGPLELLLTLIRNNKLDIFTVSLADICEPYLERIRSMVFEDFEKQGEFMDIASTLIYIKSRKLLPLGEEPEETEEDQEVENPEEELRSRLLEYREVKERSKLLNALNLLDREVFTGSVRFIESSAPDFEYKIPKLYDLVEGYKKMDRQQKYLKDYNIQKDEFSLADVTSMLVAELSELVAEDRPGLFLDRLKLIRPKGHIEKILMILAFCSCLELSKLGFLKVSQTEEDNTVFITPIPTIAELNSSRPGRLYGELTTA